MALAGSLGLRPSEVKFDQGHIAIIRSVSQAKKSCNEKLTKSDRCRTVAMYGIEDSAVGLAA